MPAHSALTPAAPDPTCVELGALELEVAARERDLAAYKTELHAMQARYLSDIGTLLAELTTLEAALADTEIRAGLRPPEPNAAEEDADASDPALPPAGCSNATAPSGHLKRMFREIARAAHPDRGRDERARYRRHSIMAEANRAYAERDEDRLRLILRAWADHADAGDASADEPEDARVRRRMARLGERLVEIDAELADLRASAIGRLKRRIDETAAQGWDLFAEMLRHIRRDIQRTSARLARLNRARPV